MKLANTTAGLRAAFNRIKLGVSETENRFSLCLDEMERLRGMVVELKSQVDGLKNSLNPWRDIPDMTLLELLVFLSQWVNAHLR